MTNYMQWQPIDHSDEPRDQQRDLDPPHTWAEIGPDRGDTWLWEIRESNPYQDDSWDIAGGNEPTEQAAKDAVAAWERAQ